MADVGVVGGTRSSRAERVIDRMKTTAGVIAAVAGAITGLWTIYEKVKSDTRKITAASYDTLAPQLNEMSEALRQLHEENQQLRQAMAAGGNKQAQAVMARTGPGERSGAAGRRGAAPRKGDKPAEGPAGPAAAAPAAGSGAPAAPAGSPPAPAPAGAGNAGSPPATATPAPAGGGPAAEPGASPPATPPPATAEGSPPAENNDPLGELIGTVNRTREAVARIRKVPETFEKVLENQPKE